MVVWDDVSSTQFFAIINVWSGKVWRWKLLQGALFFLATHFMFASPLLLPSLTRRLKAIKKHSYIFLQVYHGLGWFMLQGNSWQFIGQKGMEAQIVPGVLDLCGSGGIFVSYSMLLPLCLRHHPPGD